LCLAVAPCIANAQQATGDRVPAIAQVATLVDEGHFEQAEAGIAAALAESSDLPAEQQRDYAYQRERMRRILLDFKLDEDDVRERVRKQVPDLTDAEFAKWNDAGLFEHMVIDGRTLYFNRSPSNLFRLSGEARARRDPGARPITDGPMESLNAHQRAIRDAALAEGRSSVLPLRLRMTQKLSVDADAVPDGQTVRAWIPYPQALPGQQEDVDFVASVPAAHQIAPEAAPQRTVYLEKPARAGAPTEFSVTYELTIFGQYHAIDPEKVVAATITPELAPF